MGVRAREHAQVSLFGKPKEDVEGARRLEGDLSHRKGGVIASEVAGKARLDSRAARSLEVELFHAARKPHMGDRFLRRIENFLKRLAYDFAVL